jgi:hypothetical protein
VTGRSMMMSVTSTGVRRPGSAIISTSFFAQVTHPEPCWRAWRKVATQPLLARHEALIDTGVVNLIAVFSPATLAARRHMIVCPVP